MLGRNARISDPPIIKSEEQNTFIFSLMTSGKDWVRLGMKREKGTLFWFDGTSAERSNGVYNAWSSSEPNNHRGEENCAYIGANAEWNDNTCDYRSESEAPFVLCQNSSFKGGD